MCSVNIDTLKKAYKLQQWKTNEMNEFSSEKNKVRGWHYVSSDYVLSYKTYQ